MKKKTYVLTVSKVFLTGHPRAGQPTYFRQQILDGDKIHTIRAGEYWRKVAKRVNAGEAVLSIREWVGLPYNSKQEEFLRLEKMGWQGFKLKDWTYELQHGHHDLNRFWAGGKDHLGEVAENDGLVLQDFLDWFPKPFEGGIIHFTDFRY